jgi:hypothetical protein
VLVSRLGLVMMAWLGLVWGPLVMRPGLWRAFPDQRWLDGWARWDSGWYWTIADHGYRFQPPAPSNVNFFPLYPLLSWLVGLPLRLLLSAEHAFYLGGMLVSQVAFACAAAGLLRLGRDLVGEAGARRAVWLFCLFPFSMFFSAVYTEALFAALAIWAFVFAREERWWAASLLAGLAAVTRIPGFLVGLALGIEYLRVRRFRRLDRHALALCVIPLPLLGYLGYLWAKFGNPLLFVSTQTGSWGRGLGVRHFVDGWRAVRHGPGVLAYLDGWYLALVAAAVALLVPVWRRLGPSLAIFVATSLVMTVGTGLPGAGRYISVLFPLFLVGGALLEDPWLFGSMCVVFAVNLVIFTYQFTHWILVN